MSQIFFRLALALVIWGLVAAIAIASYIAKRGHKISIFFFRFMIYKYIHQYTVITREENGRIGAWFYHYIIAMNGALVCVVIGAIIK